MFELPFLRSQSENEKRPGKAIVPEVEKTCPRCKQWFVYLDTRGLILIHSCRAQYSSPRGAYRPFYAADYADGL